MFLSNFVIVITFFGLTQNSAQHSYAVCVFTDAANIPVFNGVFKSLQKTRTEPSAWMGVKLLTALLKAVSGSRTAVCGMPVLLWLLRYWKPLSLGIYVRKMVYSFVTALRFAVVSGKTFYPVKRFQQWIDWGGLHCQRHLF